MTSAAAARVRVVPGLLLVAWWVPFTTALVVSLVAATVSYAVTWRFKRADVERENAFPVAGLIAEAERLAPDTRDFRVAEEMGLRLREAEVRALPLDDPDLADRIDVARAHCAVLESFGSHTNFMANWEPDETERILYWADRALGNVRAALVPHLAPPKFLGRRRAGERVFPTYDEYMKMGDELSEIIDDLDEWEHEPLEPREQPARRRLGEGAPGELKRWWRARE